MKGISFRSWSWRLIAGGVVSLALCTGCMPKAGNGDVPRISTAQTAARLDDSDLLILDVRPGEQYRASSRKIQGAVFKDPQTVDQWAADVPEGKTLVLYCA